jgi:hypothetical protein
MNSTDMQREFREIRLSIDSLTQGLTLLTEGLGTQTEMLRELLELASEVPEPSPVAKSLQDILATLKEQTPLLVRIGETMGTVGPDVEAAVSRAIATAAGRCNADGEVID